ncbi:MAG TPA: hypothetical protein VII78_09705 [Myxococcota bacterium]|jgi:hypothetical protein
MQMFLLLGAERDGLALLELAIRRQRALAWGGDLDFALEWDECCAARGALARAVIAGVRAGDARPFGGALHDRYDVALRAWPHARFVYLARGAPREAQQWPRLRASERAWRNVACEIAPERRLELRYERLVGDFAAQLARLGGFLGIDFALSGGRSEAATRAHAAAPHLFARAFGVRVARMLGE